MGTPNTFTTGNRKVGSKLTGKRIAFCAKKIDRSRLMDKGKSIRDEERYDLIGDVHGHLDLLTALCEKLGYVQKGLGFEHPKGRKLIFVGDLVNRGPDSSGVLETVRKTWEEGNAFVTLGNHEFRILQLADQKKSLPDPKYETFVPWLKRLPLFLDLEEIRVVHAAWHISSIALVSRSPVPDNSFIQATTVKDSPERKAVDRILKGVKANLPSGSVFRDRFGVARPKGRLRWWEDLRGKPFSKALFSQMYGDSLEEIPDPKDLEQVEPYPKEDKTVFIGHYCLEKHIPKINDNVVCIDGCVTCDKQLWGYRHTGERTPAEANLFHAEY